MQFSRLVIPLLVVLATIMPIDAKVDFKIGVGSCHDVTTSLKNFSEVGDIWKSIYEEDVDAFVWGGDIIYSDYPVNGELLLGDYDHLMRLYNATKNLEYYQKLVQKIGQENILGTWDDHDYGFNNFGKYLPFKNVTQKAFLDFFEVDENDIRREREGIYHSTYLRNNSVKLIFLDIRYHRDNYTTEDGDFLGEEQWAWLGDELNSDLPDELQVTIVVSGLQILPTDRIRLERTENWHQFPVSRERLLKVLSSSNAPGILLVSGDVHYAETMTVQCTSSLAQEPSYLIPELTTSGMTHSYATSNFRSWYYMHLLQTIAKSPFQYEGQYTLKMNFGVFEIEANEETNEIIAVHVNLHDNFGNTLFGNRFTMSDLKSKSGERRIQSSAECFPLEIRSERIENVRLFFVDFVYYLPYPLIALFVLIVAFRARKRFLRRRKKKLSTSGNNKKDHSL